MKKSTVSLASRWIAFLNDLFVAYIVARYYNLRVAPYNIKFLD